MKGTEVKKILRTIGVRQTDVAEKMNIAPQVLASMLRTKDIKVGVLKRIAKAAGKDIFFFLGEPEAIYIPKVDGVDFKIMLEAAKSIQDYLSIFKK